MFKNAGCLGVSKWLDCLFFMDEFRFETWRSCYNIHMRVKKNRRIMREEVYNLRRRKANITRWLNFNIQKMKKKVFTNCVSCVFDVWWLCFFCLFFVGICVFLMIALDKFCRDLNYIWAVRYQVGNS